MVSESELERAVSGEGSEKDQNREIQGDLVKKLEELLTSMKDWERRPLVEVGRAIVELIKLPRRQTKKGTEPERLAIHLRLKDSFKGVFIEGYSELDDIVRALSTQRVREIAKALDELSKKRVIEYGL